MVVSMVCPLSGRGFNRAQSRTIGVKCAQALTCMRLKIIDEEYGQAKYVFAAYGEWKFKMPAVAFRLGEFPSARYVGHGHHGCLTRGIER